MLRFTSSLVAIFFSAWACAQDIPTVTQWVGVFEEVRAHALFRDLNITYAKAPAADIGFTPVGVAQRAGVDCVVVVSDGENPKMLKMMSFSSTPAVTHAFMQTVAAHEFGHCLRMRSQHLTMEMWERVAGAAEGSVERLALEKAFSIEEAYADAYAFVYLLDSRPTLYAEVLVAMYSLRREPSFANPFYQVEPLYAQLSSHGLNVRLPLPDQVDALMLSAKFN